MKLTILGTGNAIVTECYNTCFVISDENQHFLVDGGGGNTLLSRLKNAGISFKDIHDIFVTHKHIDHLLGIIWIIRLVLQGKARKVHEGDVRIFAPKEVIDIIAQFTPVAEPKSSININPDTADKLSIDENGDVSISDAFVIGVTQDIFGEKIYDIETSVQDIIANTPPAPESAEEPRYRASRNRSR